MRSRYSAFAVGAADHLYRTWHPRTRPAEVALDEGLVWTGLDILNVGPDTVEFVAHYLTPGGAGELREVSRFEERARRWFYVGPA
jgi:SEC-C motif-containing protein